MAGKLASGKALRWAVPWVWKPVDWRADTKGVLRAVKRVFRWADEKAVLWAVSWVDLWAVCWADAKVVQWVALWVDATAVT